jgi:tight adherence protein B
MSHDALLIFLGLVFLAVFLLAQGMIVPVFGESRQTAKRLKRRLSEMEQAAGDASGMRSLLREKYLRELSPLEASLERLPVMESLAQKIEQAGHTILAHRLVMLAVGLGAMGAVLAWVFTRMPAAAALAAVALSVAPFIKINHDRAVRLLRIEEQLPDAIDVMRRALQAGHPFNASIKLVAEDMEAPIAREFELAFADVNYGNDVRRAMLGLLARVPSVTMMSLVTSVLVQRETGGNLTEILGQIANVVRGRFRFHRRVKTLSAEGRMSAWVLAMVPLIFFGAMFFVDPQYMPMLLNDPQGRSLIAFAVVWSSIGIYLIRRIIRIEV